MSHESFIRWSVAVGVGIAVWLAAWLLGRPLLNRLTRLLHRTRTELDDLILTSVRPHIVFWAVLLGVLVGIHLAPLPASVRHIALRVAGTLVILSLTLITSRFLSDLVRWKTSRLPGAVPASTLSQNLVRVIVIGMGLLIIAGQLGVEITPLLTALGVGSLAVALALQPTLANLFAGLHITLARQLRVGDYVELENSGQGYIQDIGWRSTRVRELSNNLIVVPNSRLAEMVVKNYALPEAEQSTLVEVGVSYDSDLDAVERITIEVARRTLRETAGGVPSFDPFIRFHTFGESSVNFTVILRVNAFADRYLVTHDFVKRLHRRYAEEGIQIPFPQRVVHLHPKTQDMSLPTPTTPADSSRPR
jgi:small-conductance mechanosensitive channel